MTPARSRLSRDLLDLATSLWLQSAWSWRRRRTLLMALHDQSGES